MLEPEIEEGFRLGEKKRKGDKTMLEEQKLRYKLKQVGRILQQFSSIHKKIITDS